MTLKIAIVGRPNVGKSTLFNRLVGRKIAIVHDEPGVTRDRRIAAGRLYDLRFDIVDTAGLEEGTGASLEARMREQTTLAIVEADIILFLFDAIAGLTSLDEKFASLLRKSGKPIILVANKTESKKAIHGINEAYSLGFGNACAISAEHGTGLVELRDAIIDVVKKDPELNSNYEAARQHSLAVREQKHIEGSSDSDGDAIRIAIIGRPNVGKSSFINSLLGQDRLLTGDEAGLTRDSIAVDWQWQGRDIKLYDTAGLRRRSKVQNKLEKLSVAESLRAISFAEIVVVMFDATCALEKQDLHIVDLAIREGRGVVVAFNKWDLIENKQAHLNNLYEKLARLLPQVKGLRAVPVSALETAGADKLMQNICEIYEMWNFRVPTAALNRWLYVALAQYAPPLVSGRRIKIKYITQVKSRPPTFVLSCSTLVRELPDFYLRYLINSLRSNFDIWGVPIRIMLRAVKNPYHKEHNK